MLGDVANAEDGEASLPATEETRGTLGCTADETPSTQGCSEEEFEDFYFANWACQFTNCCFFCASASFVMFFLHVIRCVFSSDYAKTSPVLSLIDSAHLGTLYGFAVETDVLGNQLGHLHSVLPMVTFCGSCVVLKSERLFNPRTYKTVVATVLMTCIFSHCFCAVLASVLERTEASSSPTEGAGTGGAMGACASSSAGDVEAIGGTPLAHEPPADFVYIILRRASYNVGIALLMYALVALFYPEPRGAALIMCFIAVNNVARAQHIWQTKFSVDLLKATWPFHLTSIWIALWGCKIHTSLVRQQLCIRNQLQAAKDERIEQLKMEKDRLDYERAFALKRSSPPDSPLKSLSRRQDPSEAGEEEEEEEAQASEADTLSRLGRKGSRRCERKEGRSSRRSGERALSATSSEMELGGLIEGGGGRGFGSSVSESSRATCSELEGLGGVAPLASLLAKGSPVPAHITTGREPTAIYRLLPQYYAEVQDESEVLWLRTAEARAVHAVTVRDGLLCSRDGIPLGDGPGGEGPATYIFVLDANAGNLDPSLDASEGGNVLVARKSTHEQEAPEQEAEGEQSSALEKDCLELTTSSSEERSPSAKATGDEGMDVEHRPSGTPPNLRNGHLVGESHQRAGIDHGGGKTIHHSSLVAGGPVASAGELVVQRGRLLSLSNWSGHYAPPPSCLGVFLDHLAKMGATNLKDVKLEIARCGGKPFRSPEYYAGYRPRTSLSVGATPNRTPEPADGNFGSGSDVNDGNASEDELKHQLNSSINSSFSSSCRSAFPPVDSPPGLRTEVLVWDPAQAIKSD